MACEGGVSPFDFTSTPQSTKINNKYYRLSTENLCGDWVGDLKELHIQLIFNMLPTIFSKYSLQGLKVIISLTSREQQRNTL